MSERTPGLTLDTGALIAFERRRPELLVLLELTRRAGGAVHVLPGVLAQAWHGGPRQARLAQFLDSPNVVFPVFDDLTARGVGELCGLTGHADVVDVHVVLHARLHGHRVVTTDPDDLRRVDPRLPLIVL
jgi:predicted nucleic acid-binding protein